MAHIVILEGADFVGKTTIAKALVDELNKIGKKAYYFREPGSTESGEKIRNSIFEIGPDKMNIKTTMLLYFAARSELYEKEIKPLKDEDCIIVMDRSFYSSCIYQDIELSKLLYDEIIDCNIPTSIYVLTVNNNIIEERAKNRDSSEINYFDNVDIAKKNNDKYVEVTKDIIFDNQYDFYNYDIDLLDISDMSLEQNINYIRSLLAMNNIIINDTRILIQKIKRALYDKLDLKDSIYKDIIFSNIDNELEGLNNFNLMELYYKIYKDKNIEINSLDEYNKYKEELQNE